MTIWSRSKIKFRKLTAAFTAHALTPFFVIVLSFQIVFLPVSFALKIEVQQNILLRQDVEQDGHMKRTGRLTKGSIVEIPDAYVVKKNGKPDLELTLNNWLKTAGELRAADQKSDGAGRYVYDGDQSEYYFPVTVTGPAAGSTVKPGYQNTQHFIALKFLMRRGAALIVSDDATVTAQAQPETPAQKIPMEANSPCASGLCSQPTDTSLSVRNLIDAASPALVAANNDSKRVFQRTSNDLRLIHQTFKKSCGFELSEFLPVVRQSAQENGIPPEVLTAIMTQESSGRCFAEYPESDKTTSAGLFGINSRTQNFPNCSAADIAQLKKITSVNQLASGPRCIKNPIVNLSESIRVLSSMKNTITRDGNGFKESELSESELWRLVVSSYNGGPKWVLQAKKDLEEFNRKNGTTLNAYSWEDLRLFYMRRWLDRTDEKEKFGSVVDGRSRENSVLNLAYTENVAGRPLTKDSRPGLMDQWKATARR